METESTRHSSNAANTNISIKTDSSKLQLAKHTSTGRALALKLRQVIIKEFPGESEYRRAFASINGQAAKYAEIGSFIEFAEDMLEISISDSDGEALYYLYDMDGDKKISCDDFVSFLLGQTTEAVAALRGSNKEVIVDVKLSNNPTQDSDFLRYGYSQIFPDESRAADFAVSGTFGKGQSMWIWRRKAGTCSGRFKPVIDMLLDSDSTNSTLVLRGYVCVPTPISSQWLWIKRASTEEEEKDAIVDICVTVGKQKVSTDKIWNSPAGAGWVRVSGPKGQVGNFSKGFLGLQSQDSFVWLRPQRARSTDGMSSGNRLQGGLSEEARAARILEAVRIAVRHYVPFHEVKRLSKLQMEDTPTNNAESIASKNMLRSDRLFDFAALYHAYDPSGKGNLSSSKLSKMLNDVGVRLDSPDFNRCFYFFNTRLDGYISREEYSNMLSLTQFELDLFVEKIRSRLLSSALPSSSVAIDIGTSSKSNKIRDNRTLSDIFRIVNRNGDGILSLDEILDMAATLEYFITEDEGRKILKMMDINGDDRVEEPDFIGFMKKSSEMIQKKAHRLMTISAQLRRWLRGSVPSDIENATKQLWDDFRKRNEKFSNTKFAGFLSYEDITLLCAANLGIRISPVEARELAVLVAPDKSGKVYDADLTAFIGRGCRSFGELIAILDRDVLKPLGDAYRKHREEFQKTGEERPELADKVDIMIKDIVRQVQGSAVVSSQSEKRQSSQDVVLISQLKAGIELAMRGFQTPESQLPNLEEWACLSCLFGAINAEDDSYGVKVNSFLQGYLNFAIGGLDFTKGQEEMTIEMVCRELQRMILDEALAATKGKKPDYTAAFQLFDSDGQGTISVDEFRTMLSRLQLIDLLPETQIPVLLKMFDKTKKGYVTFEDFVGFVESNKNLIEKSNNDDDDDDEDAIHDIANAKPPAAITRNADCDWLLWFLWKECCKACPKDPESVTTDLESMCIRSDKKKQKSITVGDLWSILYETKIRGNMTKIQFDKGIKYILRDSSGTDDDLVDYDALCRYTVRIGRAHNALIQEQRQLQQKKFEQLTAALKKELLALTEAANAGAKSGQKNDVPRFEKVFRRLDTDGDGCITVQEFKAGIKRLKIRDANSWSASMIRRLFTEIDTNKDGFLSVNEFCNFIYDGDKTLSFSADEPKRRGERVTKESNFAFDDDDDDDDDIFGRKKSNADAELFKKVSDILYDMVPSSIESKNRSEEIKSAISKHFQKSDPEVKGVVTEEKFKTFCRKSGIVDKLSAQQFKSLLETLSKKTGSNSMIDYEKMLRLLTFSSNRRDAPSVKTDLIIQRLQEAAVASAAAGRNFIGLCSLVDPEMTGRITKDEFIHTVKMMGAIISSSEIESLQTLLPDDKQDRIDYKELFYLMQHQTPRPGEYDRHPPSRSLGALPLYSLGSPAITPYSRNEASRSLTTPGGLYISTPHNRLGEDNYMRTADRDRGLDRHSSNDRVIQVIVDQMKVRLADRNRSSGGSISLSRQFEVYDPELSGFVTTRAFQVTLEDLGVMLTSADIIVIQAVYGRPEDEKICYEAFCRLINVPATNTRNNNDAPFANPRTVQRIRELRTEGRDPRDIFEPYDLDRTGMIDVRKFREVIHRLQLLQSEYQVSRAIEDFANIHDRSLVCYEDFCKAIESVDDRLDLGSTRKTKSFVYGSGFDGLRSSARYEEDDVDTALSQPNIEKWLKVEASPKQRREFSNVYESLMRFKSAHSDPRGMRDYIADREEGSEMDYNLTGPKLTDSISFGRSRPPIGVSRYSNDRSSWNRESIEDPPSPSRSSRKHHFDSPNVSRSLTAPRTSPSKVGSIVWGSNTPMSQKGKVPKAGEGLWCCAVCLYVENPDSSDTCEVCDSQNYTRRKDYQVKEQCSNCTFLNGQFASECEMCGFKLSSSKTSTRKTEW